MRTLTTRCAGVSHAACECESVSAGREASGMQRRRVQRKTAAEATGTITQVGRFRSRITQYIICDISSAPSAKLLKRWQAFWCSFNHHTHVHETMGDSLGECTKCVLLFSLTWFRMLTLLLNNIPILCLIFDNILRNSHQTLCFLNVQRWKYLPLNFKCSFQHRKIFSSCRSKTLIFNSTSNNPHAPNMLFLVM